MDDKNDTIKPQTKEEIEFEDEAKKVGKLNDFITKDWSPWEETKMPAVISFNDNFEHNGLRAIKAEFVIYSNIKKVYEKISNPQSYIDKIETVKVIRQITDKLSLTYQKYKGFLMVSARDFVGLQFCELNSDNATALFFSVVNTNYPENEGYFGAYLHKVAENITFCTLFNNPDLKLTAFLAQKGLKAGIIEQIEKLKRICESG